MLTLGSERRSRAGGSRMVCDIGLNVFATVHGSEDEEVGEGATLVCEPRPAAMPLAACAGELTARRRQNGAC